MSLDGDLMRVIHSIPVILIDHHHRHHNLNLTLKDSLVQASNPIPKNLPIALILQPNTMKSVITLAQWIWMCAYKGWTEMKFTPAYTRGKNGGTC